MIALFLLCAVPVIALWQISPIYCAVWLICLGVWFSIETLDCGADQ